MNKIKLIIAREYLTRVRKKSFIIMTILGPILMAAIYAVPIYLATNSIEKKTVSVLDETNLFYAVFASNDSYDFKIINTPIEQAKKELIASEVDALIYIPKTHQIVPDKAMIFSEQQVGMGLQSFVKNQMRKEVETLKLEAKGVNREVMESIKTHVTINSVVLDKRGGEEEGFPEIRMGLAFAMGFIIYFFIFMFCTQVMRGVIEEKSNRIVEVMVSSVRPFELMAGKIIGIAMVGLTQFLLWVILTFGIITATQMVMAPEMSTGMDTSMLSQVGDVQAVVGDNADSNITYMLDSLASVNFPVIIGAFIFFFLGGYLLYASLFAAVGSAVDSESDTQQFILPLTVPLIIAIIFLTSLIENPDSTIGFWLSIIPFTSPVIMLARIPFGVPWWEIALSISLLILGVIAAIWVASKIYRTGILMYGKKVTFKELAKWLKYKN